MKHGDEILQRAKSGLVSKSEISKLARDLQTGTGIDPYTAIHVLGLMRATEHEHLVASFLNNSTDPMLARIALQVLCAHWNMANRYVDQLKGFIHGREWDGDGDVRIAALSAAGELLRGSADDELLKLLAAVLRSEEESPLMRQAAYFALARASGRDWNQLPPATRRLDLVRDVDPGVMQWIADRAGQRCD